MNRLPLVLAVMICALQASTTTAQHPGRKVSWVNAEVANVKGLEHRILTSDRELWSPTLIDAGVSLVISGHTHRHQWMPSREGQPIAQLIGGGPSPTSATLIHTTADTQELRIRVLKLDGTSAADVRLSS
ncbi:MAG: hypothetical protein AB8B91_13050 [Rubripirellula sp.]